MKKTKRLIFASFALLLSIAMTATSTYAWFTRAGTPEINSFQLSATSESDSLLINLDQSDAKNAGDTHELWKEESPNWRTLYETTEITTILKVAGLLGTQGENRLGAFSSTNGKTFTDEDNQLATTTMNDTTGGVLEFKIRFRSDSNLKVALSNESKLTSLGVGTAKTFYAPIAFDGTTYGLKNNNATADIGKGAPIYVNSAYAARLSFDNGASGNALIWNPQASDAIVDNNTSVPNYYVPEDADGAIKNFAVEFKNKYMGLRSESEVDGGAGPADAGYQDPATYVAPSDNTTDFTANSALIELRSEEIVVGETKYSYYFGSITVRIWLEGKDSACTNGALGTAFNTLLKFKTTEVSPVQVNS